MADELLQHVGEPGIQAENAALLETMPVAETEIVSLAANLEKVHGEEANARVDLNNFRAAAELIAGDDQETLIEMRKERQGEFNSLKAAVSQREAAMAVVREWTLAEVTRMRSELDSAAGCHH